MAIAIPPPPRPIAADVVFVPSPRAVALATAAVVQQFATDRLVRVRGLVARADDGAPALEDKAPVSGAAAWVAASRFVKASNAQIIDQVEKRVVAMAASGKRPVLIFDLDSTLYNNGARQAQIAREFAEAYKNDPTFGKEAAKLASFDQANTTFSNEHMVSTCGVDTKSPAGKQMLDAYVKFWGERFFADSYVPFDTVYANAVHQVQRLYRATDRFPEALRVHVIYLTGRHKAFTTDDATQQRYCGGMEQGTRKAILRDGLPLDSGRVTLMMKDSFTEKDADFKGRVRSEVLGLGEVVGAFDNEPANIAVFIRDYPRAMPVYVHTIASDKPAQPVRNAYMFGGGTNDAASWPAVSKH